MSEEQDIWYAAQATRVVLAPRQTLETFGTTTVRYHLLSELMDSVNQVRVREGKVFSERPQIITPSQFRKMVQGFGEDAEEFLQKMAENGRIPRILRYGLQFGKAETHEEIINESIDSVAARLKDQVRDAGGGLSAVVVGADEMWEVSLLKFMVDYVERSVPSNLEDIATREREERQELRREIEMDFLAAAADRSRVKSLGDKLQRYGLFEEYEDRFLALVSG